MSNHDPRFTENAVARLEIVDEVPSQRPAPVNSLDKKRPDPAPQEDLLLATQLVRSTPVTTLPIENANGVLQENVFDLYRWLAPRNALESILVRHIVILSNTGLEWYAKVAETTDLVAQEVYIKYATKCTALISRLLETLATLRGEIAPDVNVGNVNVEAGGQAIVGKVAVGDRTNSREEVVVPPQAKPTT